MLFASLVLIGVFILIWIADNFVQTITHKMDNGQ